VWFSILKGKELVGKGWVYGPGIWTLEKWSSSNQKKMIVLKKNQRTYPEVPVV
jgi:hypothetical protein